jgi:hypothetical protein
MCQNLSKSVSDNIIALSFIALKVEKEISIDDSSQRFYPNVSGEIETPIEWQISSNQIYCSS